MTVIALPIGAIPEVRKGDDLASLILESVSHGGPTLRQQDIVVISSKVVSKAEGRVVDGRTVRVSQIAHDIAERNGFDEIQVELALQESVDVLRSDRVLITETRSGLVCNFSGVDKSNAREGQYILLPKQPDASASRIRKSLEDKTGLHLAVIITDTQGRPWRRGSVNIAIGCSGISSFKYNKGRRDLYGRILQRSTVCQVDEIASLAEPLMGQGGERIPVAIVRGYPFEDGDTDCQSIVRQVEEDVFR
ncbi:MAG: coenzyme F420-0:L-glutamate ligase [Candidatus Thorarchaeota archaeon]|nr:MAG: coenzyme F420-0:L-glutamate ligase [Candidatus Thorarchaeota archaeon]